jgi:hypothetical protein
LRQCLGEKVLWTTLVQVYVSLRSTPVAVGGMWALSFIKEGTCVMLVRPVAAYYSGQSARQNNHIGAKRGSLDVG